MLDNKEKDGFTLIEILIVIVIISVTVNFAILAFGDFGAKTKITHTAENFVDLISLIKKEAILTDQTMAIKINKDSYEILRLNNNHWQPCKNSIYKKTFLPNGAFMFLINKKHKTKLNYIIINATGRISPFTLSLGKGENNTMVSIICDSFGNVKIENKSAK
jgi:general secretion pathway protein H